MLVVSKMRHFASSLHESAKVGEEDYSDLQWFVVKQGFQPGNYYYLFFDTSSRRGRPSTWTAYSAACGLHLRGDCATSLLGKEMLVL